MARAEWGRAPQQWSDDDGWWRPSSLQEEERRQHGEEREKSVGHRRRRRKEKIQKRELMINCWAKRTIWDLVVLYMVAHFSGKKIHQVLKIIQESPNWKNQQEKSKVFSRVIVLKCRFDWQLPNQFVRTRITVGWSVPPFSHPHHQIEPLHHTDIKKESPFPGQTVTPPPPPNNPPLCRLRLGREWGRDLFILLFRMGKHGVCVRRKGQLLGKNRLIWIYFFPILFFRSRQLRKIPEKNIILK